MSYIWLNGYRSSLTNRLTATSKTLPIDDAQELAKRLSDGHSYLLLNDGTATEIVKATSFGKEVKIERGQEGTTAKAFPAGACVKWEVTKQGITDTICNKEFRCCEEIDDCGCGK